MAIRFKWKGILLPAVLSMGIVSIPATSANTEGSGKLYGGISQWLAEAWLSLPPIAQFRDWQLIIWIFWFLKQNFMQLPPTVTALYLSIMKVNRIGEERVCRTKM
ncbi:MAG: hypothetical protein COA99_12005 [Moraxellaceae bacterium]|nr:MAG: hypothetical protein COA99_12005 [Moraxellaceae bacterium]